MPQLQWKNVINGHATTTPFSPFKKKKLVKIKTCGHGVLVTTATSGTPCSLLSLIFFYFLVEKENKKLEEKDKMKKEGKKKESKEEGEGELGLELDGKRTKNGTILGFRI